LGHRRKSRRFGAEPRGAQGAVPQDAGQDAFQRVCGWPGGTAAACGAPAAGGERPQPAQTSAEGAGAGTQQRCAGRLRNSCLPDADRTGPAGRGIRGLDRDGRLRVAHRAQPRCRVRPSGGRRGRARDHRDGGLRVAANRGTSAVQGSLEPDQMIAPAGLAPDTHVSLPKGIPPQCAGPSHKGDSMTTYAEFYRRSLEDRDAFWAEQARLIDWQRPPQTICDYSRPPFTNWFTDGVTNLCHNAVDRHLKDRPDQPALIYVSSETGAERTYSFRQLHDEVQRAAAVLKSLGVRKGDRVLIYMPMIAEAAFAILACARI